MKTREFIERVMSIGIYEMEVVPDRWIRILSDMSGEMKAVVYLNSQSELAFSNVSNLDLIKICTEYAETPINDREEVPLYRVQLPDEENLSEDRVYVLARITEGTIMINRPKLEVFKESQRYMLTEEEIKRNHSYLWQFAKRVK